MTVVPYIPPNSGIASKAKASRKTRGAFGVFGPRFGSEFRKKQKSKGRGVSETCPPGFRSDTVIMNQLLKLWDVTPEDLKSDWMDLMVKRLFAELNRQLCQVESKKDGEMKPGDRMENARVLASLQQTLEKLARMEAQRDLVRKGKNVAKDRDARKALERKLDQLAAARGSNDNSERAQQ
ncbi:MAG TPA: hypothetical protein VG867_06365 [Rhizomicrobium sp.]|nr:hypothetical protein [Rhizomicrobium sp.]